MRIRQRVHDFAIEAFIAPPNEILGSYLWEVGADIDTYLDLMQAGALSDHTTSICGDQYLTVVIRQTIGIVEFTTPHNTRYLMGRIMEKYYKSGSLSRKHFV